MSNEGALQVLRELHTKLSTEWESIARDRRDTVVNSSLDLLLKGKLSGLDIALDEIVKVLNRLNSSEE